MAEDTASTPKRTATIASTRKFMALSLNTERIYFGANKQTNDPQSNSYVVLEMKERDTNHYSYIPNSLSLSLSLSLSFSLSHSLSPSVEYLNMCLNVALSHVSSSLSMSLCWSKSKSKAESKGQRERRREGEKVKTRDGEWGVV